MNYEDSSQIKRRNEWLRVGAGREIQFFATDDEVQEWLTNALPHEYEPYVVLAVPDPRPTRRPTIVRCDLEGFLTECYRPERSPNYWLASREISPKLVTASERVDDATFSINGLILVQHGLRVGPKQDSSRIAIVDKVRHKATGEMQMHIEYLSVFRALAKEVQKSLVYTTVRQLPDGGEQEDSTVRLMTNAAAQLSRRSDPFVSRPGRVRNASEPPFST